MFNFTHFFISVTAVSVQSCWAFYPGALRDLPVLAGHFFEGRFPFDNSLLWKEASPCYPDLGCFEVGAEFFHPVHRPVNLHPRPREQVGTVHWLFVPGGPSEGLPLLTDRLDTVRGIFRPAAPVKVIVHGWVDPAEEIQWIQDIRQGFLESVDCNVIVVDWSGDKEREKQRPPYTQAVADARIVAAEIALLLHHLQMTFNTSYSSVHLIGHSLGAHIAGYVGQKLPGIGRITALDPAQPYYQGMPASVRLDSGDATYVDAWHTDAKHITDFSWGMTQSVGHVDIFPNGGREQPGCKEQEDKAFWFDGILRGLKQVFSCSHGRANWLASESLYLQPQYPMIDNYDPSKACLPVAFACKDYETFLEGLCADCGQSGERCAPMSILHKPPHTFPSSNQHFYLLTGGDLPYCLFHYQIRLELLLPLGYPSAKIKMSFTFHGILGAAQVHLQKDGEQQVSAGRCQIVLLGTTPLPVGPFVEHVALGWAPIGPLPWAKLHLLSLLVVPMNHLDRRSQTVHRRSYQPFPLASLVLTPRRQVFISLT